MYSYSQPLPCAPIIIKHHCHAPSLPKSHNQHHDLHQGFLPFLEVFAQRIFPLALSLLRSLTSLLFNILVSMVVKRCYID